MDYYWPILLIVGSNTVYHIASKGTSKDVNAFVSLAATYIIAALACIFIYLIKNPAKSLLLEVGKMNWATIVLSIAILGLEVGNIFMYRAGWNISVGSLVANIAVAVVLIFVGLSFFKEQLSIQKIAGIALCVGGLILINK